MHLQENYLIKMTHALWKGMLYPDLKENQKRIMSQKVPETSCTNKSTLIKVNTHIKFDDEGDPLQKDSYSRFGRELGKYASHH